MAAGAILLGGVALAVLGAVLLELEVARALDDAGAALEAVAALQAQRVEQWLQERRSDARALALNPALRPSVATGPRVAPGELTAYLRLYRGTYRYVSVALFRQDGTTLAADPPGAELAARSSLALLERARRTGEPVAGELYRAGDGSVRLDVAAPVPSGNGGPPGGAVLLQAAAGDGLFALLSRWPYPSRSAESLLVRRDGEDVLYVSPLKARPEAALELRRPLSDPSLVTARAVLAPGAGQIVGVDHRGVAALAVGRPVAGTSWVVVARIEKDEVLAPARADALRVGGTLGLLAAVAVLGAALIWRRRRDALVERQRESERRQLEAEERINRMYLALSRVNEEIVRATDAAELTRDVCRILVEAGGFRLAWVGAPGPDGLLEVETASGDAPGYLVGGLDDGGPAAAAFRGGCTVVVDDPAEGAAPRAWQERARQHGLRASVTLPLLRRGTVSSVLSIHAGETGTFGDREVELAGEVARDLSFAYDVLARDEERRAAEESLRAREEIFSSIVGQALDAIALVDPSTGRFVEFNEAAHAGLGYTREEFALLSIGDVQAEHSPDEIDGNVARIREAGSASFETRHRRRDGAVRTVHVRSRWLELEGQSYVAAVWTDITERKRAEAERQALLEIMLGVAAAEETVPFLGLVHAAVGRVVPAESFFVLLQDPATELFVPVYFVDRHDPPPPPSSLGRSLSAWVVRKGEAVLVTQELFDRLVAQGEVDPVGTDSPSWLGVPLREGGRSIGILVVQDYSTAGRYSERDREFLVSVAAQVAVAIERQRSREALLENAARLEEAQRIAAIGVWELDLRRNRLAWSDEIYRMFGLEPRSFAATYEAFLAAIHPADRDRVNQAYTRSLETREPYEIQHRLLLADGTEKIVLERCVTWFGEAGRPLRSVGTVQDVTARRAAEEAVRAAKERLEEAQALARVGSWERTLSEPRAIVSPEVYRILERDPASFDGSPEAFLEAVHPDDREALRRLRETSLETAESVEIDHRIVTPDGRVKWVTTRRRIEPSADGPPVRVLVTIQDITEHLLAQEARRLAAAKEAAETANRAKSEFLASMSHEIRTPMNAILGFAQLLAGDPGTLPRQREQLLAIQRSGEHLLGLIDGVLEMSKIEAGRLEARPAVTDLDGVLSDLESMLRLRAREKGLALAVETHPGVPRHVVTDEKKLRQILINLTGNAVKFTARGGVRVGVRAEPVEAERLRLVVEVADTGPGISADELPRLFRSFEQTRTGRQAGGGTGLGLAISRAFARLMGGDITVASRAGEGSVFTLSLPVVPVQGPAGAERAESRRVVGLRPGETRRRLLVVDDVAENREILAQMLGRVGFDVTTADDGRQALDLVASWSPHGVLMDLRMPGMDGLDAIRALRARETEGRLPIVAVTASAFEEDRLQAAEAGSDGFISKPFREEELLATLARCLGVRFVREGGAAAGAPGRGCRLAAVPEPLCDELRAAVAQADLEAILQAATRLEGCDAEAARTVRALAEGFEYERLAALLEAPR